MEAFFLASKKNLIIHPDREHQREIFKQITVNYINNYKSYTLKNIKPNLKLTAELNGTGKKLMKLDHENSSNSDQNGSSVDQSTPKNTSSKSEENVEINKNFNL